MLSCTIGLTNLYLDLVQMTGSRNPQSFYPFFNNKFKTNVRYCNSGFTPSHQIYRVERWKALDASTPHMPAAIVGNRGPRLQVLDV